EALCVTAQSRHCVLCTWATCPRTPTNEGHLHESHSRLPAPAHARLSAGQAPRNSSRPARSANVTARFTHPRLTALVVAGAVLLPSPGLAAVSAPVSQISSSLTQPNLPAFFRVVGTGDATKTYDVLVSLSKVPCPGKYKFRSTVDSLLDSGSTTY